MQNLHFQGDLEDAISLMNILTSNIQIDSCKLSIGVFYMFKFFSITCKSIGKIS